METTTVTNDKGRKFTVRIVSTGDAYGRNRCLTHDKDTAMVEFYDATYAGNERFDAEGQFVGRYSADTLLNSESVAYGLDLHCGEPAWKIDAAAMQDVMLFVRAHAA